MGVIEQAALRQAKGQTFALATVVRTVSITAAKAGAKALIGPDGEIARYERVFDYHPGERRLAE